MGWKKHEVIWTPDARADLLKIELDTSLDVAIAVREAVKRYAGRGIGDVLDPMTSGPWRGRSRIKPTGMASDYRVIFLRFPVRRLIRIDHVRPRDVVYLDAPSRSR